MAPSPTELLVADAAAFRSWLESNHATSPGEWLVLAKKGTTQPTSLSYDQALEEALCYGWVDGQLQGRDGSTFLRRFTPRSKRSRWSRRNTDIVDRLIAEGRMRAPGMAAVEAARADGRWDAAYAGSATAEVPPDLAEALAASPKARSAFEGLSRLNRYAVIIRTEMPGLPATRQRRIAKFVAMLERGETVYSEPSREAKPH